MIDSTQLLALCDADYKMLREKGKKGEAVMHYNGYLDGFGEGFNACKEHYKEKVRKVLEKEFINKNYIEELTNKICDD